MAGALIDTHVLVWMLDGTLPRRSRRAAETVAGAVRQRGLHVSIGSFLDLRYLVDSGRMPVASLGGAETAVKETGVSVVALDIDVHRAMGRFTRQQIPDPFDRIIAATSVSLGVPLVSADRRIRLALGRAVVW